MVPMRSLQSAGDHVLDKIPIKERLRRGYWEAVNIERNKAVQLDQYLTQTEAELDRVTTERNEALESLDAARLLAGRVIEERDTALKEIHSLRTELKLAEQERTQMKDERKKKRKQNINKMMTTIANKMLMAAIDNKMKRSAAEMETQARPKQGPTKTTQGGKGTKRAT